MSDKLDDDPLASSWPPRDVVAKLCEAARHLLDNHDCDCQGYELVIHAWGVAQRWLDATCKRKETDPQDTEPDWTRK